MSNELIINSTQDGERIALLQDKRLVEFHHEKKDTNYIVGDIFLGTVKKVMPGLNAAFIDIGYHKDAFLHYHDLGANVKTLNKYVKAAQTQKNASAKLNQTKFEPEIDKLGKIADVLKKGQQLLVQIVKEPISTKGPRLSCELSLAGRYLVLVPFSNTVSVSKKIVSKEERTRLKRLITSIKPENFGVIIRTVAEGREVAELDRDLRNMVESWEEGFKSLKIAKPNDKIIGELGRSSSILRDLMNESFDNIVVDDESLYDEIKAYIGSIAPDKVKILKHYTGKTKTFEHFNIERQLKAAFGKTVTIPGGGYLVIEHTEALHVVDVNSGNKSNTETDQEATALNVNMMAAKEVARQLRLRDIGGIIVIDFIDMKSPENRQKVYEVVKEELKRDRSKSTVLPISKFGLMQITRQRVRPEQNIVTGEVCPTCNGTGKITASILITDEIDVAVDDLLTRHNHRSLTLYVHPFLYAYYTSGVISKQMKWFFHYFKWVKFVKDTSLGITDFKVMDDKGEEIELRTALTEVNGVQDQENFNQI
ncbi:MULTISPECIES: Rne/Rng family ribonuclease [Pontibacter]|uniref:Ribonuclease G n=1 Tax=Pontibacter amylolyticus TaxID=1424080 RepID=A0ABQ1WHH1_9BACT|nr:MULTISPECIES: Rne/Rng family ribonuclease [Pontibacter]MCP2045623.1 ribonuclease G [Pontibacter sp. HSC-36F09]GGG30847.1 ribonuclease G [Pontibacter amylolyticus]